MAATKPNLLVLGASGGVANAFLHYLVHHRDVFGRVVLLDKNKKVLSDQYIDHKGLRYEFVQHKLILPKKEKEYSGLLKKYNINLVLDLTDEDSIPILESTSKAGINYINTALNGRKDTVKELTFEVIARKNEFRNAINILCAGMNPGIVNMLARHGIERHGRPNEIIHFEYDTARVARKWRPMMTWSVREFLTEVVWDPTGMALGRDNVKEILPNGLKNRVDMKPILSPIMNLDKYPRGFLVLHEENITLAHKYDLPSRFIYAINMQTMERLLNIYKKRRTITEKALMLGDNANTVLEGSDNIGVLLKYDRKYVYYFNSVPNNAVMGTSATYLQVAVGIFAAIFALLFDGLKPGVYFTEDLFNTHFKYYVFDNMRVQEFVFKKQNSGKLKILGHNPEIKVKRTHHFEHMYI